MADDRLPPGFIQETVSRLRRIQKANQIEGLPDGGVTITYVPAGIDAGTITVAANIPYQVEETPAGQVMKAIDFAQ